MAASIVAIGNPGVGKSTTLNALAGEHLFNSGISFGSGMTYQLDERTNSRGRFFDTPGLADDTYREAAGQAISEALRKGGPFKVLFFIMTESGRVVKQDVTTLRLVLDACPELGNNYGIVINKLPPAVATGLQKKENAEVFLSKLYAGIDEDRRSAPSNLTYILHTIELDSENDKVVGIDSLKTLDGTLFSYFIYNQVPTVNLTPNKALDVKVEDFDKTTAQMEEMIKLMEHRMDQDREAWKEEQKRLEKARQEKEQQLIEDKRRHEESMALLQAQAEQAQKEMEKKKDDDNARIAAEREQMQLKMQQQQAQNQQALAAMAATQPPRQRRRRWYKL